MPDTKITALAAITTVDPAADVLPIVDISDTSMAASGTTKKITSNQILGAGGTATLASATITGDLTVRTNKLKVTSIGVGAGTTTPAAILHSTQTSSYDALILDSDGASTYCTANWRVGGVQKAQALLDFADDSLVIRTNTATGPLKFGCNNIIQHRIDPLGVFNWYDGAGGTRMTLNATGLGVGVTPSAWGGSNRSAIQFPGGNAIQGSGSLGLASFNNAYNNGTNDIYIANGVAYKHIIGTGFQWYTAPSGTAGNAITFTQAMTLDASGNLLVGQTSVGEAGIVSIKGSNGIGIENNASGSSSINANFTFGSGTGYFGYFKYNGTLVGTIASTGAGNCTFNQVSDYRLKEDVQPIVGALNRINSLKPSTYKWKINGSAGEGFLAHELAAGVPLAVTGEKDAVNEDGSIQPQQVDLSKVVPILVAAIQELTARVQTLETR